MELMIYQRILIEQCNDEALVSMIVHCLVCINNYTWIAEDVTLYRPCSTTIDHELL